MTAYLYSISQHFTGVDKNPYNGEKLMWSILGSLDQDIKHDHSTARTGGDSSNKGCFGRKTNLFRESGDFAGNRETWEIFREK